MNSKPVRQLWLPLLVEGELGMGDLSEENPTERQGLMEQIVAPENLRAAYGRVVQNKGAPGVDGMTVDELATHLRAQWPAIREQLLAGTYRPAAVRRKELPKPGGGIRVLGIPTVQDRFIQQATRQVLQAAWDPIIAVNGLALIAARHHMIDGAGEFNTDRAWHAAKSKPRISYLSRVKV